MSRKPPESLRRQIKVESGHRCAIPTCKSTPVEIAHITPWSECKNHEFSNLIALCPTCHTRFDGGDISKQEMKIYKMNLSILNNRYGDLEQRVLRVFSNNRDEDHILLPGGFDIMLMNLLEDGLIVATGISNGHTFNDIPLHEYYKLTKKGRLFIEKWVTAKEIEYGKAYQ